MADSDISFWSRWQMPLAFIVIAALVIAGGYASYIFIFTSQASADAGLVAGEGDSVSVQYIGMFEDGRVFDTSIQSVAENDTLYPKSLSFSSRYDYAPLNFTIGTGSMIKGFENGVVGMAANQTKTIIIPPEMGYGQPDASLIFTRDLVETVPVYEWFGNSTDFVSTYGDQPLEGMNVKSVKYGWNVTVFFVDGETGQVMLRNSPSPGEILTLEGSWSLKVVSIDTSANVGLGEITIRNLVYPDIVGKEIYTDAASGQQFFITAVDEAAGTFTTDYNREVVGKTLVFKVTVVSIIPSA